MGKAGRAQWFTERAGKAAKCFNEGRLISGGAYHWDSLGPFNIGGRSTAIVVDPRDPQHVLVGSAAGGVWTSPDGGRSWTPIGDQQETLNVGALALDPRNPDVLYVGTGEANLNVDAYPGLGLYEVSGSGTWKNIGPDLPRRIATIAVDPHEPGHIYVGGATDEDGELSGLFEGRLDPDGTWRWSFVSGFAFGHTGESSPPNSQPYRCHTVLFHPVTREVYATVYLRGWRSGIWRLREGGWEQLKRGLPSGEHFGRTSLAMAPSDPRVLWAYAAHRRDSVLGVFVSHDGGDNWQATGVEHFAGQTSTYYNNCIAVHPTNPQWVICGGTDLYRTRNDGTHWERITEWDLSPADDHYAHADHHALAVTPSGGIYDANDGGVAYSEDFGSKWETRQAGLVTTMFYDLDVAPTNEQVISGGSQDNGTLFHAKDAPKGEYLQVKGDDGGWTLFHPEHEDHMWASSQNVDIAFSGSDDDPLADVTPPGLTDDDRDVWMSFLAIDSSPGSGRVRPVFLGTKRIWRTVDEGTGWKAVSPIFDGSTVTAIEVAEVNPRFVCAGTRDGGIFCSIDGGNCWSENVAGVDLPPSYITRIKSHPKEPRLLLTVGATPRKPDGGTYPHVYLSENGFSWRALGGKIPDVPHNSVAFESVEPFRAFVATDIGVYVGTWNNEVGEYDWDDLIGDMPNVVVTDLVYHKRAHALFAATYGRGIFRLNLKPRPGRKSAKRPAKQRGSA